MKIQLPIVGHASGRNGNMIYQTYHGSTYVRTKPFVYHYPYSPAQEEQSTRFRAAVDGFTPQYRIIAIKISNTQRANRNIYDMFIHQFYDILFRRSDRQWWSWVLTRRQGFDDA